MKEKGERIMTKSESKYFNTAQKMHDAFLSLLEKKDFDYISVSDVCKEAKVNRSTFYLHYQNVVDLLEEVISDSLSSFYENFDTKIYGEIDFAPKENLVLIDDKYIIPYLNFIKENRKLYQIAMKNSSLFKTEAMKKDIYTNLITKILDRFEIEEKYKGYVFDFFVGGIVSIVSRWCLNDCDLEVSELADFIKKYVTRK